MSLGPQTSVKKRYCLLVGVHNNDNIKWTPILLHCMWLYILRCGGFTRRGDPMWWKSFPKWFRQQRPKKRHLKNSNKAISAWSMMSGQYQYISSSEKLKNVYILHLLCCRKYHSVGLLLNIWVINSRPLFETFWCHGVGSVTTNACDYLNKIYTNNYHEVQMLYIDLQQYINVFDRHTRSCTIVLMPLGCILV